MASAAPARRTLLHSTTIAGYRSVLVTVHDRVLIRGIIIAAVGRWRGPLRWPPLAAEMWGAFTIAA